MNIANWLYETAIREGSLPALYCGEELVCDYHGFAIKAAAIGFWLHQDLGVAPGDRVAILLRNCPEYLPLIYGCWWIGAVAVPINAKLHPHEVVWIVENSGAKALILNDAGDPEYDRCRTACAILELCDMPVRTAAPSELSRPRSLAEDENAWLFYTSGTTGRPKGATLSHKNLRMMSYNYTMDVDDVHAGDQALYAAPMSHGAGLYNFPFVRKGAAHVIPSSQGFDALEIVNLARRFGRLSFFAAPTMVKRLIECSVEQDYRGDGIKTIVYGGGPMYAAEIDRALEIYGDRFVQVYGQGETPMTISVLPRRILAQRSHPEWKTRRASVGIPAACVELRVVDENLQDVPVGEAGEILVSGNTVMKGYWNNPEATASSIVGGWLRTGDVGVLDEGGFLTLTDRIKDVIISGGTNIYPREIEEILLQHPQIREASVVGVPDPEWGESVAAFVVLADGSSLHPDEIKEWLLKNIASFKRPRKFIFMNELPKNNYGKILKTELRRTHKSIDC